MQGDCLLLLESVSVRSGCAGDVCFDPGDLAPNPVISNTSHINNYGFRKKTHQHNNKLFGKFHAINYN